MKRTAGKANKDQPMDSTLHQDWPLGGGEHEIATTELEWAILRFYAAFERCTEQLADMSGYSEATFQELVLLHVVAMQRSPQSVSSLARQLNRDDIPNLQYAIRKLTSKRLLESAGVTRGKQKTFALTPEGRRLVDKYAILRRELLTKKTQLVAQVDQRLGDATRLFSLLTGLYDNVAQSGATYRRFDPDVTES